MDKESLSRLSRGRAISSGVSQMRGWASGLSFVLKKAVLGLGLG